MAAPVIVNNSPLVQIYFENASKSLVLPAAAVEGNLLVVAGVLSNTNAASLAAVTESLSGADTTMALAFAAVYNDPSEPYRGFVVFYGVAGATTGTTLTWTPALTDDQTAGSLQLFQISGAANGAPFPAVGPSSSKFVRQRYFQTFGGSIGPAPSTGNFPSTDGQRVFLMRGLGNSTQANHGFALPSGFTQHGQVSDGTGGRQTIDIVSRAIVDDTPQPAITPTVTLADDYGHNLLLFAVQAVGAPAPAPASGLAVRVDNINAASIGQTAVAGEVFAEPAGSRKTGNFLFEFAGLEIIDGGEGAGQLNIPVPTPTPAGIAADTDLVLIAENSSWGFRGVVPGKALNVSGGPAPTPPPGPAPSPVPATEAGPGPTIEGFSTVYAAPNYASNVFQFALSGTQNAGGGYQAWTNAAWAVVAHLGPLGAYKVTVDTTGWTAGESSRAFVLTANNGTLSNQTITVTLSDAVQPPAPTPGPTPGPGPTPVAGSPRAAAPPKPSAGVYVSPTLPGGEIDWYYNNAEPIWWPADALGQHASPGAQNNGEGQRADWPPAYGYGAARFWDLRGRTLDAANQWARMQPTQAGAVDYTLLWEMIDDHLAAGRTMSWCPHGTPLFAQKYPGEEWGFGYITGGASPAKPGFIGPFLTGVFDAMELRYGRRDVIKVIEPFNEPRVGEDDTSLDSRYTVNAQTKFWRGSARDMARIAVEICDVLPAGVYCGLGAWEGKTGYTWNRSTYFKFIEALKELGRLDVIQVLTFHQYVYKGPSWWYRAPDDSRTYHGSIAEFNLPNVVWTANSEQGAEYSDGSGANGSKRLYDYTDAEQATWLKRVVPSQIATGASVVWLYTDRLENGSNDKNEFDSRKTQMVAAMNWLHDRRGSWIYKCGRVLNTNQLFLSIIRSNGTQENHTI